MLTTGQDGSAFKTGQMVHDLSQEAQKYLRFAGFSHDGERAIVCSGTCQATVFDMSTGAKVTTLQSHGGAVMHGSFSRDGALIVTASADQSVRLSDKTGKEIADFRGHEGMVYWAEFSTGPEQDRIATASADGTLRIFDLWVKESPVLLGHHDVVRSVVWSVAGDRLVTASDDGFVRVWSSQGAQIQAFEAGPPSNRYTYAAFSPRGEEVTTCLEERNETAIFRVGQNEPPKVTSWPGVVRGAVWSPSGDRLLGAVMTGPVLRDVATGATRTIPHPGARSAFFDREGNRIVTAGANSTKLWDRRGNPLASWNSPSFSAIFSPRGSAVLTTSGDERAQLRNLDGKVVSTFSGHRGSVIGSDFSPDGERVATGSRDRTIRLWDLEGRELLRLTGHLGQIGFVSYSPDSTRVASSSWDRTARVWIVDREELLRVAAKRAFRDFTPEELALYEDILR